MIIGAGMAGITAARRLTDAGVGVTIIDKGRRPGGRMASRLVGGALFDHGAQFFTVRDPRFRATVDALLAGGSAARWSMGFVNAEGEQPSGNHARYCGTDGMNGIPKALADGLGVQQSVRATRIACEAGRWRVETEHIGTAERMQFSADALLMNPPAEQSLALLAGVSVPDEVRKALEAIEYDPCIAVMAVLDAPSKIPAPGGVYMPGEPISWMSDNQQKGISTVPAVTIHAGPDFTRAHYDDDKDEVARRLIDAAKAYLGDANVVTHQVQRWRYSQPSQLHDEPTIFTADPAPLAFAGDAYGGARVEGAYVSGLAAAEKLLDALS